MPSGKVHFYWWKKFLPFMAVYSLMFLFINRFGWVATVGVFLGYLSGGIIDPDLDQVSITSAEGRALKVPVFGHLFVAYSTLYGAIFRRKHRKKITHSVYGTAIRFVYFFWPFMYLAVRYRSFYGLIILPFLFVGLTNSDYLHIILDKYRGRLL